MRTYAAHAADLDRNRYAEQDEHNAADIRGAKAILRNPQAAVLAKQTNRMLASAPHHTMSLLALPAGVHIIEAMETLGIVEQHGTNPKQVSFTDKGRALAGV